MTPFSFSPEPFATHFSHSSLSAFHTNSFVLYATRRDSPTRNPYTSRNVQFERELGEETTYTVGELSDGVNRNVLAENILYFQSREIRDLGAAISSVDSFSLQRLDAAGGIEVRQEASVISLGEQCP